MIMMGTVNRFNKIKGYGFVTPDDGGAEIFVHFSKIQLAGYKELKPGQKITFTLVNGDRGPYATEVKIMD